MRKYILINILLFLPILCAAYPGKLKFQHYTILDGLSHNSITCIFQDSQGFLWIGTSNRGINKFDGYEFKVYLPGQEDSVFTEERILEIFEDSKKRLWVGCSGNIGLRLYCQEKDNFPRYFTTPDKKYGYLDKSVQCISEDQQGYLWLATSEGLVKFNPNNRKEQPVKYLHDNNNPNSISGNSIKEIYQDSRGNFWIGTSYNGLNLFDTLTQTFTRFKHTLNKPNSISDNSIISIIETKDSTVWVGTKNGLNKMVPKLSDNLMPEEISFVSYTHDPDNKNSISNNIINDLHEHTPGILWVCTSIGLNRLDYNSYGDEMVFSTYKYDPVDLESLLSDFIWTIYFDSYNNMWVGTTSGLNRAKRLKFEHYKQSKNNELISDKIETILEDRKGNIWLGTSKGINMFDIKNKSFQSVLSDKIPIKTILNDHDDNFWIGTWRNGLMHYNPITKQKVTYNNTNGLEEDDVFCLLEKKKKELLVGTWGGGLYLFDREKEVFTNFKHDSNQPNSISNNYVCFAYRDSHGTIWIGTYFGLNILTNENEFITIQDNQDNPDALCNNYTTCIHESADGALWVGSFRGLYQMYYPENIIHLYTVKDGLPDNAVTGILEDDQGDLWVSFMNGFAKLSFMEKNIPPGQKRNLNVTNFDIVDGLQGKEFVANSCLKTESGVMLFGGRHGFNMFHPDSIHKNTQAPTVVFTGFQLFNKDVAIGEVIHGDTILAQDITQTKEISLSWKNNVFSFRFAALHFLSPMQNKYAYMLDGFDKGWNYTDASRRYANYTNLNHGNYVFKVKASNKDGVWSPVPAEITINISPPWWRTTWFKIALIIMGIYLIFLTIKIRTSQLEKRKKLLIKMVKQRTIELEKQKTEIKNMAEKLHEADQKQLRFFTNISHEFRTPLTLIIGPLQKLLDNKASQPLNAIEGQLQLMQRNASKMLRLINQLIDFRKIAIKGTTINPSHNKIIAFLREITDLYKPMAVHKKISLQFITPDKEPEFWFEPDAMEKIIGNLLSNAIKYTPEGGEVSISIGIVETRLIASLRYQLAIEITDTGIGIPPQDIDKIFDRFYMAENKTSIQADGVGLGLAYTKELVELHQGTIKVSSQQEKGTTFAIFFPFSPEPETIKSTTYQSDKFQLDYTKLAVRSYQEDITSNSSPDDLHDTGAKEKKPLLLLVEDNPDMRLFIKNELIASYEIKEAKDGVEGLEIANQIGPDIIISDIMMPRLNGIQFCEKLKTNGNTSHIPIILLTAKTGDHNTIEGLKTGADDYISKPFNSEILKLKIFNLLEMRKHLREKFGQSIHTYPEEITTTSIDEEFITKAIRVVEEKIEEPDFNNQQFIELLGHSKSYVYKKLKNLTNQSLSEFIRTIRLKKAASMLLERQKSISEICYSVGYKNHPNFTRDFNKMFGKSPSEFIKSQKK